MNVLTSPKLKTETVYQAQFSDGWVQTTYLILDVLCILMSGLLAFSIRFTTGIFEKSSPYFNWFSFSFNPFLLSYVGFLLVYVALIILLFEKYNLYHTLRERFWIDEAVLVIKGVSVATLILMISMYLSKMHISRLVVLTSWGLNVIILAGWRYLKHKTKERRIDRGIEVRNILIIGAGKVGNKLAYILQKNRHLGLRVRGFIDDYKDGDDVLGQVKDLPQVLRRYFIDEVFITIPSERELVKKITEEICKYQVSVKVIPELFDGIVSQAPLSLGFFEDLPVMELYREPISELGLMIKRAFDIVEVLVGTLLLFPLLLAIAIAIKIDSPDGPIVYRSKRMGRKGQVFECYKFRTMVPNADVLKEELRHLNEREGPFFKITDDPRITRVGRFLRKYNLDEIPQFFNVLKGEMSLVGPRPHPLDDFSQYTLDHYGRLDVKPGMTSLWAVEAQDDPSFERNMELDLYYIANWSLWLDINTLIRTISTVCKGKGR